MQKNFLTKKIILIYSKKLFHFLLYFILPLIVLYVLFAPKAILGELFFGRIPSIYNITLSKFFYRQALLFDQKKNIPGEYVHYQLGRIAFIEGNFPKVLDEMRLEISYYPENYRVYYVQGLTFGYMNRERDAIESFKVFVDHNPDKWAGRNDLAWLQFRIGDIDGALTTIAPAYTKYPNNPWVLNTYGAILMNKKRYTEAKRVLEKGLSIANGYNESQWGIAYPGNDPRVYPTGLEAMRNSFISNLKIVNEQIIHVDKIDQYTE